MAIRNVITRGFGPGATIGFVVTRGYSQGAEPEPTPASAGADYSVRSQGRGRKRRYFIELDGRRLYGRYAELVAILEARAKPPLVERGPSPPAPPVPVQALPPPAAAPLPEFQPVDLEAYRLAREQGEAALKARENAAISLLLLT